MNNYQNLQSRDLRYIWHPCSQMKDYETLPPIIIEKAKGAYLYDLDGKRYIDAISSWWCNLLGHSHDKINEAISSQIKNLEHVIFANFSNIPAITLSERLASISPEGLEKIFFTDNGSSAIEAAMKMSFHFFAQTGKPNKKRFIALTDAYHGETVGALSAGDLDIYSKVYKPLLLDIIRVESPDCFRCPYGKSRQACNCECFDKMEKALEEYSDDCCAVLIEPLVQAAAGMKIYPPLYLKKLRTACDYFNVQLIADEIAVGFGRTGMMFACEHAGITPDYMCLSKGITGGYMPMAAVLTTNSVYNAFYDDYNTYKAFMHSHTYCGNAMACAIGNTVLDIIEEENILEVNKVKSNIFKDIISSEIKGKNIGEIRGINLINAVEIVQPDGSAFDSSLRVGYQIYKYALSKGVLLRPLGNVIYFNPPYCINEDDMQIMAKTCMDGIKEVLCN